MVRSFCASNSAVRRLDAEGINRNVYWVGDVMLDSIYANRPVASQKSRIIENLNLTPSQYGLVTVHRAANTDDPERLMNIIQALNEVGEKVVFPVHPRTRSALHKIEARYAGNIALIDPVGYYDMMMLEENARIVATDSGGVQREAYFMRKPCLTMRDETEWTETVQAGWNILVGVEKQKIIEAWKTFTRQWSYHVLYWSS